MVAEQQLVEGVEVGETAPGGMIPTMAMQSRGQAVTAPRIAEETPGLAMRSPGQAVTVPHIIAA